MQIRVAVNGACGNMGQEVCRTVLEEDNFELVSAVDIKNTGEDLGEILGGKNLGIPVNKDLNATLQEKETDVLVDFTSPLSIMSNIEIGLQNGVRMVVGTTGLTEADLDKIRGWVERYRTPAIIAPNFALGAVLMTEFAALAARYFDDVEIIELHHDQKIDAPSGTALKTAARIIENRPEQQQKEKPQEVEKLAGARGGNEDGIHIHSVRLPGLVAHQEVIFGGTGQTLTFRHDSLSRKSFMPGVVMAVNRVMEIDGLVFGLENLIDLG